MHSHVLKAGSKVLLNQTYVETVVLLSREKIDGHISIDLDVEKLESRYTSSYKAVGFVHSNESASAFMNFYSFEGRMVFKLKSSAEGDLKYTAKLESGNATVYYDFYGTKQELFSISAGEELDSHGGYVESGTVYIIVETDGTCQNGDFQFSLKK